MTTSPTSPTSPTAFSALSLPAQAKTGNWETAASALALLINLNARRFAVQAMVKKNSSLRTLVLGCGHFLSSIGSITGLAIANQLQRAYAHSQPGCP